MPVIGIYQFSDITTTGPDPWLAGANANASSPGNTTFTLAIGAEPILAEITDDDLLFGDNDNSQTFTNDTVINGVTLTAGSKAENEYSYGIRPVGSTDPADIITVYSIDEGGATPSFGFASSGEIIPGVTYEIISVDDNSPSASYDSLYDGGVGFLCFASGTQIRTPEGERSVETLGVGDLVNTLDHGAQRVLWAGARELRFTPDPAAQKPILFSKGSLGRNLPQRDLKVSPQHRMYFEPETKGAVGPSGVLAAAKAFVDRPGVRQMAGCRKVTYHTLLFPRHEILFAEGALAESFYPAPYGLSLLTVPQQLGVLSALPHLTSDTEASYGPMARRCLKPKEAERAMRVGLFAGT